MSSGWKAERRAPVPGKLRFATLTGRLGSALKHAFVQFLALPLAVVLAFLLLSVGLYQADRAWSDGNIPLDLDWLGSLLGDSQALGGLLTTIATSIITVTSITFSLLPVAVQQGSSALTAQVVDQFMMRRANQFYFGFFVGLSLFVLVTMVTASPFHRPIFAASAALVLTAVALCMIVVMIHSTIDQMRPAEIIAAIHRHTLSGREMERRLLARSRNGARGRHVGEALRSPETGYVERFDFDALTRTASKHLPPGVQVEVIAPIGSHVAAGDPVFRLRADEAVALPGEAPDELERDLFAATTFSASRDLSRDPSYGLFQLSMIAWTSVSTAKSNPGPGLAVIHALRDIIARWSAESEEVERDAASPIVYPDRTPEEAVDALESIVVVASESIQVQTLVAALHSVALLLRHASDDVARHLAALSMRSLATLGEHVMTRRLELCLDDLAAALDARGFGGEAQAVRAAAGELRSTVGKLNSRSTRVPSAL